MVLPIKYMAKTIRSQGAGGIHYSVISISKDILECIQNQVIFNRLFHGHGPSKVAEVMRLAKEKRIRLADCLPC